MNVDRGSIHVTTSDSDKVDVKVVREVRRVSAAQSKEILEQHKINITESGNEVRVEAEHPKKGGWGHNPSTVVINQRVRLLFGYKSTGQAPVRTGPSCQG